MNRRLLTVTLLSVLVAATAQAGLFKNAVDLADLSEVPPESLQSLTQSEFEVFVAQVHLSAAKAAERQAAGGVKATDRTLEAENLDMKAAKAELKAAKANQDEDRTTAAAAGIAGAEEDLATAKALRKWKEQEQEARQAEVAMAKSAVDLAEAKRDLARLRLLQRENAPSLEKYDLAEFERSAERRRKEHDAASRKAADKTAKVEKLKSEWARLAKNIDVMATE